MTAANFSGSSARGPVRAPSVAVLTLHESSAMRRAAEMAGADGFVAKSEFTEALPRLLEEFSGEQQLMKQET